MESIIPHKPDYLNEIEWEFVLSRDLRHCAFYKECASYGRKDFCSLEVDIDHAQPRELGGDDSVLNVRLLCRSFNRGRPCESDVYWSEHNRWDEFDHNTCDPERLRVVQAEAGWNAIDNLIEAKAIPVPQYFRRDLLGTTTLLVGATGTGKTITAQAAFCRFNRMVGVGFPRIKHVLWLTCDTGNRDLAHVEIRDEAFKLGILSRQPSVHVAKSFADLVRGPNGADVTVSAAQSLWDKETTTGPMRTDQEKLSALARFDTIVFDEGDWALDQLRKIAQLARHALQFSLTATPKIDQLTDGHDEDDIIEFRKRFILIAPDAVADYQRAVRFDQCLKLVDERAAERGTHGGFDYRASGVPHSIDTQKMQPDHVVWKGTIMEVVHELDRLETRMKELYPDDFFSPHVMVRMQEINDILVMRHDLDLTLRDAYLSGELANDGWQVSCAFAGGNQKKIPAEEREIAGRWSDGRLRHPFMVAKSHRGRVVEGAKRILLMCNIGSRGINNWPISAIVDCTANKSPRDLIQFCWGRPIRLPLHLRDWVAAGASPETREFVTIKVRVPDVDGYEDKLRALEETRQFILTMQDSIAKAGFMSWADIAQGKRPTDKDVIIDASNRPLTEPEKFALQAVCADVFERTGELEKNQVVTAVGQHPDFAGAGERLRSKGVEYVSKLIDDEGFRDQETVATHIWRNVVNHPENVMERLHPQKSYTIDDLKRWVKHAPEYREHWREYVERFNANDTLFIHAVSQNLRRAQTASYRPVMFNRALHGYNDRENPGVFMEIGSELKKQLEKANQMPEQTGLVYKHIIAAAKTLFDIDDAGDGGPMDHPAYKVALLTKHRKRVQWMARGSLIEDGHLGTALKGFSCHDKTPNTKSVAN